MCKDVLGQLWSLPCPMSHILHRLTGMNKRGARVNDFDFSTLPQKSSNVPRPVKQLCDCSAEQTTSLGHHLLTRSLFSLRHFSNRAVLRKQMKVPRDHFGFETLVSSVFMASAFGFTVAVVTHGIAARSCDERMTSRDSRRKRVTLIMT